ncbi:MAG: N-terminal cleavage protein [Rariglobus sp.]|jgi:general secretion pathway protein G|nr:N-terminal cleavage protein [Rariglobus sp.]
MNPTFSRRRPSGFTLIELLTVIAIIGVLAGIIIAVVGNVRRNAQKTESLAKLREIGTATLVYTSENRGVLPVWYNYTTQKHWWRYLQAYLGENPESFHSPAHEGFDASTNDRLIETISYGWNYAVSGRHVGDPNRGSNHSLIVNDFPNPSKVLISAEARESAYGFIAADTPPAQGRYGENVPSVFLDGHVDSRPYSEFLQIAPWFFGPKEVPPYIPTPSP